LPPKNPSKKRVKKVRLATPEEPSSKRPRSLWNRAEAEATAAALAAEFVADKRKKVLSKSRPAGQPESRLIKTSRTAAEAKSARDRRALALDSNESEGECIRISSDSSQGEDTNAAIRKPVEPPLPKESPHSQPPSRARAESNSNNPTVPNQSSPVLAQHQSIMVLNRAAVDGSCLFDSLARSLDHILQTDAVAFSAHSARSAREAINALKDPKIMRSMICDHLSGELADTQLPSLGMQTPREAVCSDYIQAGQPLFDPDWEPPAEIFPAPVAQFIDSFDGYIAAMRKKCACGDEICIAACIDLLGLRHIVFDVRDQGRTTEVQLSLDFDPVRSNSTYQEHFTYLQTRTPSSRMPIILLRDGLHFDWMHCESDAWNAPETTELL
jgi:hypothetical protein